MVIEKAYIRKGKYISFLWKPKVSFSELRQYPVIISPIVIAILLLVMNAFITFLFSSPTIPSSMESATFSRGILSNAISTSIIVLFTTTYVYLLYRIMKNKQRFKELLSIVLHAQLASLYIFIIFDTFFLIITRITGQNVGVLELTFISTILLFIYLGIGLKWGVNGTNRQFLIVLISYIIIVIIFLIALILLLLWIFVLMHQLFTDFLCALTPC